VRFLTTTGTGKGISIAAGLFLGATFVIALYRTYQKYSSPRAQRKRMVGGVQHQRIHTCWCMWDAQQWQQWLGCGYYTL
jgi:uncharacterized membrane protein